MIDEVTVASLNDRWDDPIDEAEQEGAAQLYPERSPLRFLERVAAR